MKRLNQKINKINVCKIIDGCKYTLKKYLSYKSFQITLQTQLKENLKTTMFNFQNDFNSYQPLPVNTSILYITCFYFQV